MAVTYGGDTNYPQQSNAQTKTINVASVPPPSSSLTANHTGITTAGSLTLTATVTGVSTSNVPTNGGTVALPPTGTVTFTNAALGYASAAIPRVPSSTGAASTATLLLTGTGPGLAGGSNTFTASYSGDGNYNAIPTLTGTPTVTVEGLTLSATSVNFGSVGVGGSKASVMSLYNYTAAAVKINPIGTGISTGSAIFPVTVDNCSGTTLSAGKSCSFTVSFAPSGTGPQSATLAVSSALATNPTAALSGTGVANGLTLNTAAVAFGNVGENTTKLYTVTVYNYTANAVTVTGMLPTMPFVTLGTDNCTGKSVAVNASCTVALNFTPTALGLQSGTLTVSSALATIPRRR